MPFEKDDICDKEHTPGFFLPLMLHKYSWRAWGPWGLSVFRCLSGSHTVIINMDLHKSSEVNSAENV